jgi:hypothetical protein
MAGFYNIQQACAKLNKTEEDLRKLVRDGLLREFRDAKGPAYKSDEVDALTVGAGDADEITLLDTSAGAPAVKEKPAGPEKPAAPEKKPAAKSDSSVFSLDAGAEGDAAKTDVFSLEPAGESSDEKKSGSGSGSSISLLDDLENITIPADPMAETVVASGEGIEGAAGGSGLMDLARESDDTSLGAELYDEPAEAGAAPVAADSSGAPAAEAVAAAPMEYYVAPPAGYEIGDPMAPAFIAMSVVGLIALLVAGMAVAAGVMGSWPRVLEVLYSNVLFYLLGSFLAAGAAFGIGFMINRQAENRRNAMSRVGAVAEVEPEAPAEG